MERKIKIKFIIKRAPISLAIRVYKIPPARNRKSTLAKEPLIKFHLAFVTVLPIRINSHRSFFARRLVIHHDKIPRWVDPYIINGTGQRKMRRFVIMLQPFKILSPDIKILVLKWNCVHSIFLHNRMRCAALAVIIKFFFKKFIHGNVERKWVCFWFIDT